MPVRHLSSSSLLYCRPNKLARGHFRGASKYPVAIKRFVYFIYQSNSKIMLCKKAGKITAQTRSELLQLGAIFLRTHMYFLTCIPVRIHAYQHASRCLSNYITPNTLLWHTHCANNATLVGLLALSVASLLTISLPGRLVLSRCLTLTRPSFLVTV